MSGAKGFCPAKAGIEIEDRRAYFKKNPNASWPPDGPGHPCQCKNYLEGKEITRFCPKYKYIQPARPANFAPDNRWCPPASGLEKDTVYARSYLGFNARETRDAKQDPFLPVPNLHSSGDFATDTTMRMSYPGWACADAATPIMPRANKLFDSGPLQSQTTNRHDYTPKPASRLKPILPCPQLLPSDRPMEDTTTMLESYQDIDWAHVSPAVSCRPDLSYHPPNARVSGNTVQKMSYVPWPTPVKEDMPWAKKARYQQPETPFDGETIYNNSYAAPGTFMPDECYDSGCVCYTPGECLEGGGNAGCGGGVGGQMASPRVVGCQS